ncbi:hypothetical protein [Streptomyces sp. MBT53]|uniref:hypothetical protein n=1 Tax=Streptomyces sp. MBT53 TaxID=1488384 RepID=UPI001F31F515|nr:hypothetical protein [Streptomyces sp. MBT53]
MAALLLAFQLNASGATGKSGDGGDHMPPAANASAIPGDDTAGDHAAKPGENK